MLGTRDLSHWLVFGVLLMVLLGSRDCLCAQEMDWEQQEQLSRRIMRELEKIERDLALEPGDEVVALRDTPLKVQADVVGTLRRGKRATLGQVEGKWLWMESDGVKGWVDSGTVMDGKLFDWYQKLPDMATAPLVASASLSVGKTGRARGKIFGVRFELRGLEPDEEVAICFDHPGPGTTVIGSGVSQIGGTVTAKGHRATLRENGVFVAYGALALSLDQLSRQTRALIVSGRSFGTLREGDHVLIDASGRVFVNGQVRRRQ